MRHFRQDGHREESTRAFEPDQASDESPLWPDVHASLVDTASVSSPGELWSWQCWYCLSNIGVKVFSATKARERELLGEAITDWIRIHPEHQVFDKVVTQSSDAEFHCLTITLFYRTSST